MSATEIVAERVEAGPVPEPQDASAVVTPSGDTIFSVLAAQARRRSAGELRTTAIGCGVNAGLLLWQHPNLSWLAAALAAASAYGLWGLMDRRMLAEESKETPHAGSIRFLRLFQAVVAGVGSSAAAWAVFQFMAAALGGWIH
jgi:hypothetical protein